MLALLVAGALAAATMTAACGSTGNAAAPRVPAASADRFDGRRAWAELVRQTRIGPRPAGSPALARLAARLARELPGGRIERVPGGLRNVVGRLPGRRPAVVVAAHYDTKEIPGFVGANDAAGGTAAVLELARSLRSVRRPAGAPELRFVLFDGEEQPAGATGDFYATALRGSKAYLAAHRHEIRAVVLLDFIANRGLRLPREAGSDVRLWARLRAAARRVGVQRVFPAATRLEIVDDHTPFVRAGIPAIDLIDFEYPWWHTVGDTPDKLSWRSLDAAGEAVVELLRTWR